MPGRSTMLDGAAVGQFGDSGVLLHGDAGEIGHLLAQSGEAIEEGGLAGVGRPDQRHRADRGRAAAVGATARCRSRGNRRTRSSDSSGLGSDCRCANLQTARGVAAQGDFGTIHLEDARIAAGGAEARGNAGCRERNQVPSGGGHRRWEDRCGRGSRRRLFAGRPGLAGGASDWMLLPLSCNMVSVCCSPKSLSIGLRALVTLFSCHGFPGRLQVRQNKG